VAVKGSRGVKIICSDLITKVHFVTTKTMLPIKKLLFTKVAQFGSVIEGMQSEVDDMKSFSHESSLGHKSKVVQLGSVIEGM
jgi:hypothetical protein